MLHPDSIVTDIIILHNSYIAMKSSNIADCEYFKVHMHSDLLKNPPDS